MNLTALRNRKLVQWGFGYLAAAWVLIQAVEILSNQFNWSSAVGPATTVALGFGFLLVLVLAWYHGERGAQRVTATEGMLITMLVLGATTATIATARARGSGETAAEANPLTLAPDQSSIAVLPFVNMSGDQENEYFSDGLTEELLNALAKVEGLRVAARTSSFAFKGRNESVPSIGKQLRVSNVLEGSVRKSGNRLRITAQLIKVEDGYHVWSEAYDRELADVFAIQDEISSEIVSHLVGKLLPRMAKAQASPDRRVAAYDLYLKGRALLNERTTASMQDAVQYFERAVAADSSFVLAHVGRAEANALLGYYGMLPPASSYPLARRQVDRALALDADVAEAHGVSGLIALNYEWDWAKAERELRRAIKLKPSYAQAFSWYGIFLATQGRWLEADSATARAYMLDPLAPNHVSNLGVWKMWRLDCAAAIPFIREGVALSPTRPFARMLLSRALFCAGDRTAAAAEMETALRLTSSQPLYRVMAAAQHAMAGRRADAVHLLSGITDAEWSQSSPTVAAATHAWMNQPDSAFKWLDRAYAARDPYVIHLAVDPQYRPLHKDARFAALLKKLELPPTR